MALISQQILNILGGVSQQPDKLRASSQMEAQVNVYDSITFGKIKRPPTTHIAKLSPSQWSNPFIHAVNRDAADKYHVVVANGQCFVFDGITGAQYQVLTPQGTSYLTLNAPGTQTQFELDEDTFKDTAGTLLTAHPSDTGQAWTVPTAKIMTSFSTSATSTNLAQIFSSIANGVIFPSIATQSAYFYNQTLTLADYSTTVKVTATTNTSASSEVTLGLRTADSTSSNFVSGYFLNVAVTGTIFGNPWTIYKVATNGTLTVFAAFNPGIGWSANTAHTIGFSVQSNVLTATLDGVLVHTVMDGTFTAPGLPYFQAADNGSPTTPAIILTPFTLQYLETINTPPPLQDGFRFTTVQDTTFIVNQTVVVEPLRSAFTEVRNPEALITLTLADYATNYYVTIDGVTIGFQSPVPAAPQSRVQLSTDLMTQQLLTAINGSGLLTAFEFTLLGQIGTAQGASTIYLTRTDGADFTISANDGLNDGGIVVVKGTVQNIATLPARALNDMVIKVQPDPQNNVDVAYYRYDNLGSPNLGGVWVESAAPGILTSFDPTTMPWQLTRSGDVLSGFPADGPPPLPTITFSDSAGPSAPVPEFTSGGTPYPSNQRFFFTNNGPAVNFFMPFLGGVPTTLTWTFDYDFTNLPLGQYAFVTITDVHAGTSVINYLTGSQQNYSMQQITSSPVNSEFQFELNYSIGSNPPSSQIGTLNLHGFSTDPLGAAPGLLASIPDAVVLTWNEQWTYAGGVQTNVDITGPGTLSFTPSVDQNADQMATDAAALSFSGYTSSASGNTTVYKKSSGAPGATTVSYTWNNAEQYHSPGLQLAPNELVGFQLMDLTDGSSGIVASNTATTVTLVAPLSGGITNSFRKGDLVSVTSTSGRLFFVLQPINWALRAAGDDTTNPFPGFTFSNIVEVGFTSGRLCLFSGENIVCSESDSVFNMWRTTVTQLLDSDPINVSANSDTVSDWHSMVHWAEGVWLFAGNVQAQLPTEPALSNSTVSIQPLTKYQSQPTLRPLAMDRRIYFARLRSPNSAQPVTEILRYQRIRFPFQGFIAEPATKPIPTYLAGTPLALVGDPVVEIMVVLTSAVPNQMYPYIYHYSENQEIQMESWSTWQIEAGATILAIDFLDGVMGMLIQRADGVYFEQMDLQFALYEQQ